MKTKLSKMNLWLLVITVVYSVLGCIMIYSASSILTVLQQGVPSNYYFIRQVFILIISLIASIIVTRFSTKSYKFFAPLLLIGILASLVGLFIAGKITNGTKGWYDLGFFNFQPSEFAKPIIILYLASTYDALIKKKEQRWFFYLLPLIICMVITYLVYKQPDLGSAIIIAALSILIFLAVPIPKKPRKICYRIFFGCAMVGIMSFILFKDNILANYQKQRFDFSAPCSAEKRTEKEGYQVCNGFIAIKNGGLLGVGFGNSTQKYLYLPEAHTDFIFPIIVEELGLIVGILIIIGYIFMLLQIIRIANKSLTISNYLICYGTCMYLALHILINLLGVLGLMPLTGVPLPFFSYGGSFAINAIVMIAVVEKISIDTKDNILREKIRNL